jgi:hypothetical protein
MRKLAISEKTTAKNGKKFEQCILASSVQMKSWAEEALETVYCFAFLRCTLTVTANLKFINKKIFLFLFVLSNVFY